MEEGWDDKKAKKERGARSEGYKRLCFPSFLSFFFLFCVLHITLFSFPSHLSLSGVRNNRRGTKKNSIASLESLIVHQARSNKETRLDKRERV